MRIHTGVRLGAVLLGTARFGPAGPGMVRQGPFGAKQRNDDVEKMALKIRGIAPMMPTSTVGLDPFDPLSQELKKLTDVKKKTLDMKLEIQRVEWKIAMAQAFDPKLGPCIPGWNVTRCIRNAARATKMGKVIERGVQNVEDMCPMKYDGPRTLNELWADGRFVDKRAIKNNGGGALLRTRAIFREWEISCPLYFDPALIDESALMDIVHAAGQYEGIGQYRPRFGRFEVIKS